MIIKLTEDVDILPHGLDLVGCGIEDDDPPLDALLQDTYGEGLCLMQ